MSNNRCTHARNLIRHGAAPRRTLAALAGTWLAAAVAPAQTAGQRVGDWTMWGGAPDRNMMSNEKNIPGDWDLDSGRNIKWKAKLGSQSYGNPVISKGQVYVGTNNNGNLRPGITGDKGVMLCYKTADGGLLWQATHDKLPTGRVNDWPEQGICSSPVVEGERLYYVSNRCELVCADVHGMHNGNDGPFKEEQYAEKVDADFIWILDMIEELSSFPHNLATCSPVMHGDLIFVNTSNGVDEGHINIPNPSAPSFVAVNKNTGKVVWESSLPGEHILHGQWSSPAVGVIGGEAQVVYAAGDGWCYGLKPASGELLWKFNCNPPDAVYKLGGRGTKCYIIATPVIYDNKVHICVGQDPEHGEGPGHLYSIDATKRGDITESGRVWHVGGSDFHRSLSTVAIADGLLYASDLSGFLYCFDLKTGKQHWKHDVLAAVWGSPYVVDGKVFLGDEDGELLVMQHGPTLKELRTLDLKDSVYTTPVASGGVLYVANRNTLYAFEQKSAPPADPAAAPKGP